MERHVPGSLTESSIKEKKKKKKKNKLNYIPQGVINEATEARAQMV